MFRKQDQPAPTQPTPPVQGRITSILGEGISWKGELTGTGGIRIEGLFEGKIELDGLIIIDPKGRVESDLVKAETIIVAGSVRSDIQAQRVEIRSTGRVWGNVTTVRFSTEEGAYLRGKIQMEEGQPEEPQVTEVSEEPALDKQEPSQPELKPKNDAA
jgi:cytoskeletal protein CcmA (bactofilin family)